MILIFGRCLKVCQAFISDIADIYDMISARLQITDSRYSMWGSAWMDCGVGEVLYLYIISISIYHIRVPSSDRKLPSRAKLAARATPVSR